MDELVEREFQALRDQIAANERAHQSEMAAEQASRRAEKLELNGRLDRMNEFRSAMQDQAARFITRPEFEDAKAAGVERAEINRRQLEQNKRSMMTSGASMVVSAVVGAWLIIGLKIDTTTAPLRVDLEQVRTVGTQNDIRLRGVEAASAASTQADTASRTDRAQINERLRQVETQSPNGQATAADVANLKTAFTNLGDRLQEIHTAQGKHDAALIEIETQFCGQDNMRSQIHSQDLRTAAMLWKKVFGETLPTDQTFYARIGRCASPMPNGG